jgi:hypothetical protein
VPKKTKSCDANASQLFVRENYFELSKIIQRLLLQLLL